MTKDRNNPTEQELANTKARRILIFKRVLFWMGVAIFLNYVVIPAFPVWLG